MRKFTVALLAGIALSIAGNGAGFAADLPTKAPVYKAPASAAYNWTGFYLGINGGGAWGNTTWADPTPPSSSWNTSGWLVGGTAGYNWQAAGSPWVVGIEGDLDAAKISGTGNGTDCTPVVNCQTQTTWLATVRGRGGYAWDRWLAFATGGAAFGNIQANATGTPVESANRAGWTVGGGAEYAFAGQWSLKGEYLYVDLGSFNCTAVGCSIPAPTNVNHRFNVVRAGINHRF